MRKIKHFTKTCDFCQRNKSQHSMEFKSNNKFFARHYLDLVCSDIVGPFNTGGEITTCTRKFYFITFVDIFSRGLQVYFIPDITSKIVVEKFKNFIEEFGKPKRIHTDNGRQYISKEFNDLCNESSITHSYSPRNIPQSNGVAERLNSSIKTIMRIYQNYDVKTIISRIHNFHNHSSHSSLNSSPNEKLSGFSIFHPLKRNLLDTTENLQTHDQPNLQERFNDTKNRTDIKIGQLVLTKVFSTNKLTEKFEGPFEVINLDLKAFKVEVGNSLKRKWESLRNVKPYFKEGENVVRHL